MNVKEFQTDALVVGAGPAGLALCNALLQRGIETLCVAPTLQPWAPNYGAWLDEISDLDIPVLNRWSRARVSFPKFPAVDLARAYARLDSAALYRDWSARLESSNGFIPGVVASALFSGDFHEIRLTSGVAIRARQVFDASGHSPQIVARGPSSPAFQTAYGVVGEVESKPMSQDTMGLMLWDDGLISGLENVVTPAFYYVMPESDEKSFIEYTVLASRPYVSIDALERRLTADGVSYQEGDPPAERCFIPMGHAIPRLDQLQVGFGGAASMVHPATGYMVARTFRTANLLADAYLGVRGQSGPVRARALWDVIWPDVQVRAHYLYCFGLEALLEMDVAETHEFFAAFFSLPLELWRPYQSGTATPREIAAVMWAVFAAVGPGLKLKLAKAGFGPHRGKLAALLR